MTKTNKLLVIITAVIIVVGGIGTYFVLNSDKDNDGNEEFVPAIENSEPAEYAHDTAIESAVASGLAMDELSDLELGMSVEEVNKALGSEGKLDYELGDKKAYVYTEGMADGKKLEIIFEKDKLLGIAIVE